MTTTPPQAESSHTIVDLLVVGSGTGMAAALAANELGLSTLIVEKTAYIGGSMAKSGGAFWIPANPIMRRSGSSDSLDEGLRYLAAVVGDESPEARVRSYLENGSATVDMLSRMTPMTFVWDEGYPDYHPEEPGGSIAGRTCECRPFNASVLGADRKKLRPGILKPPIPMPITGGDYRLINLMVRFPRKAVPLLLKRIAQGVGGRLIGRRYVAAGQALAAGMYAGVLRAGIPVWTDTALVELTTDDSEVTGAVLARGGNTVRVTARRGVVLASGGFDHQMEWRRKFQSESLCDDLSLGAEGSTGDGIRLAQEVGAATALMDQAWWFPAIAPLPDAEPPMMLSERSLPGSLLVDQTGCRFVNEACDYMSFGQRVLERERAGAPIEKMWLIFDQRYRNSYLMAGAIYPRMPIPRAWYDAGIAYRSDDLAGLAAQVGLPVEAFTTTMARFNEMAAAGRDLDFERGNSAYDWYYGDPTVMPNPNLLPLQRGPFYAVKSVLSDLGTCGGLRADERARVLREDGTAISGLYAIGNTAANAFGTSYPGAGATIGQGLVFGHIAARDAAQRRLPSHAV
ncbi:3-ketosteroid-delta-1-dehydrogenase [Mycolicibacterium sp. CH28]|uniref:3-ketosteroid-delta-1-dehydrogenase n=1 Tax=Mycolicibacterium sp. CH28 TaxID=2512237 RepID=UPI00108163DD|nr:3-ketosteroid-delta-1-dehydrogenase [Mycolicibacterium sp. CH28]TGD87065.1 3-ketosteroid-delta-1-dehydrogenase [Mycolicibacterium sp. CH28]